MREGGGSIVSYRYRKGWLATRDLARRMISVRPLDAEGVTLENSIPNPGKVFFLFSFLVSSGPHEGPGR